MREECLAALAGMFLALVLAAAFARAADARLAGVERSYAAWLDAVYAVQTLEAGAWPAVDGLPLAAWRARVAPARAAVVHELAGFAPAALEIGDRRALELMRKGLDAQPSAPAVSVAAETEARCAGAANAGLDMAALSSALYACFERYGNHVNFEGRSIARATALELLQELDAPARRKALFAALEPLWSRIHSAGAPASAYRRLIRLAANEASRTGSSPIEAATRTLAVDTAQAESWMIAVLERWRAVAAVDAVEPWDYWHHYTAGSRALDPLVPADSILAYSARYYRDLGADLDGLGVLHDLALRPGKAPLAYADYVRIGRSTAQGWRPAIARVSANVEHGGLYVLNEIVHEDGHAVHYAAVRARPAFSDLGDDLFVEAFADVAAWSLAEKNWQHRYLGRSAEPRASLRALHALVVLEIAWGLFEMRLLHNPELEPNVLWTEITQRYLNILPHPELAWWALRVQLVDTPGYMINYGLGALLTADLRRRIRAQIGRFDAGNPHWYPWLSRELLHYGAALDTPQLLRHFFGRPVSPVALLAELDRIVPPAAR
jgi:hypothetical protein